MFEVFTHIVASDEFPCVERVDLPDRSERTANIPTQLETGSPGRWLTQDPKLQGKLWLHQARALEAAVDRRNVVIATGTASGKSTVFQAAALRVLDVEEEATVIVFYPLKALAKDQLDSWHRVVDQAGLDRAIVEIVDGSIRPADRMEKLRRARILLMTPDVCHAWLLRELATDSAREFIARTALIVIDEAHTLEGVFGSNLPICSVA